MLETIPEKVLDRINVLGTRSPFGDLEFGVQEYRIIEGRIIERAMQRAEELGVQLNIYPLDREQHVNDMLAFLSGHYVGAWGEWAVRIVGGLLLLSAGNTAITDMISVQYLMARDGELPRFLVKLNRFGVP